MGLIRVLIFLVPIGQKVDSAVFVVDVFDLSDDPNSLRNLIFELAGFSIEVEVVPAVALRRPENFAGSFDKTVERLPRIEILVGLLAHQGFLLAGGGVHNTQFLGLVTTLIVVVVEAFAVGEPVESGTVLKWKLDRRLDIDTLSRLDVEDDRRSLCQHLTGERIDVGERAGAELIRRDKLQTRESAGI